MSPAVACFKEIDELAVHAADLLTQAGFGESADTLGIDTDERSKGWM